MKKLLSTAVVLFAMMSGAAHADKKNGTFGIWLTDGGESKVEVYPCGASLCGKIIWLKEPNYGTAHPLAGQAKRDRNNKNKARHTTPIIGLQILSKSKWDADDQRWEDGEIYSPKKGKTFESRIWLDGAKLKVRGYSGWLHETKTWTRSAK